MLEIKNIHVQYGNIKALNSVSLTVQKGDIVSLIGANGAGKSSLLKAVSGLEPITQGTIEYNNQIINSYQSSKRLRPDIISSMGIALVPEGRGVFSQMTVLENLEMGAFLVRDKAIISKKLLEIYAMFPILKDRKDQKSGSLSGGEQQMLAIGRALMSSPEVLLLDEPGLGLAPLIIKGIFEVIRSINDEYKTTIFIVEQNAKLALKNSNKGFVMETGVIVLSDLSANLIENPQVKAAYLGE
ncbi:MAG: ABC transporter ATP-binding protein [Spirochaetes bacterium GWF1_31_7]|nr:MAG: ABC transporter ATP-binding protein [Spirochaetes bacterium GWE1_32_154]OHD48447.1 MAG: ABC transporter ATP-binding protein [Spirochaetes bacterium GWE2_31_10]OHD50924.1 MAG: ABC transporter ATP-binding protein [Spirochaetes bacterium GWF1_31_7]OHD79587.1 MAG: ABC transporter ATP-binding protein [Spirochaetes bacterium RIFOXYB1_FULL_32_8]HBD92744.1 ABC transporter ATP-binding protein [Spirochaetia bacterium]